MSEPIEVESVCGSAEAVTAMVKSLPGHFKCRACGLIYYATGIRSQEKTKGNCPTPEKTLLVMVKEGLELIA